MSGKKKIQNQLTRETTLRKKIIQTLADGNSFSIYTPEKTPELQFNRYTIELLREMEDEGKIVSEQNGTYKIKK